MHTTQEIIQGDCLEVLKTLGSESVNCAITSPPYFGLRDYGVEGQIGLEETPELYTQKLVELFRELRRVLKNDGTLWLNLGDSYSGSGKGQTNEGSNDPKQPKLRGQKLPVYEFLLKPKDLIGIPWRVAFALQADGWYLRQDVIWHKPNPMPESVTDRCTKSHEYIFLLSKSSKYYFDHEAIQELATGFDGRKDTVMKGSEKYKDGLHFANGNANSLAVKGRERWKYKNLGEKGQSTHTMHENRLEGEEYMSPVRNKRSVWTVATKPYSEAHFATFPEALIEPMILAGCPKDGTVLDPFSGAATTGVVAKKLGRNYLGIELNPAYIEISNKRLENTPTPLF